MTSPTLRRWLFLLINNGAISVPSRTEPPRIAKPIPAPMNKPPKTAVNNLSGYFRKMAKFRANARPPMPAALLIANLLPSCLSPTKIKGRLMTTINIGKGIPKRLETSIETPVTPPSMKWVERRKPSKPKVASSIPTRSERNFSSQFIVVFISELF